MGTGLWLWPSLVANIGHLAIVLAILSIEVLSFKRLILSACAQTLNTDAIELTAPPDPAAQIEFTSVVLSSI